LHHPPTTKHWCWARQKRKRPSEVRNAEAYLVGPVKPRLLVSAAKIDEDLGAIRGERCQMLRV
jgi:hypothetical protein